MLENIARSEKRPIKVSKTEFKEVVRIFKTFGEMCRGQEEIDVYLAEEAVKSVLGFLGLHYD